MHLLVNELCEDGKTIPITIPIENGTRCGPGHVIWTTITGLTVFNLLAPELFFLILAHSVYKM